jgi:hypothetical protein
VDLAPLASHTPHVRWALFAAVVGANALAEEKPILELKTGAVGVVYLAKEDAQAVTLRLVFPSSVVEDPTGASVERDAERVFVRGRLVLFDGKGELGEVNDVKFVSRFWCENDGGQQHRAEATVKVSAGALARPLEPVGATQSIAAFVVVAPLKRPPKLGSIRAPKKANLAGDFDGDGKPEAVVTTRPDDAQNCDGEPRNNLTVTLTTAAHADGLRCCGP